jgi:hypothetical protein
MQAWPPRSRLCQSFCPRTIQTWHLSEEIWLGEQHMRHKPAILFALVAMALLMITLPGIASAHETRTVASKYATATMRTAMVHRRGSSILRLQT